MPGNIWRALRPLLVATKRLLLLQRPFGLGSLGKGTIIIRPYNITGRKHIFIGKNSQILQHSLMLAVSNYESVEYSPSIEIGENVYIGRYAYFVACTQIQIGEGCVLSEHVYITDLNHGYDPRAGLILKQAIENKGPVILGANCFLGYRTTVVPGVTLGEWCIVGANSVVTRSFPAYSMIAGAPAKLIKTYSHKSQRWVPLDSTASVAGEQI